MSPKHITAAEAKALIDKGAVLVDIREASEYAAENIPSARNAPLTRFGSGETFQGPAVIFHCKSGARTRMNARILADCAEGEAYILDGGIEAWKAAGLPVKRG